MQITKLNDRIRNVDSLFNSRQSVLTKNRKVQIQNISTKKSILWSDSVDYYNLQIVQDNKRFSSLIRRTSALVEGCSNTACQYPNIFPSQLGQRAMYTRLTFRSFRVYSLGFDLKCRFWNYKCANYFGTHCTFKKGVCK